MSRRVLFAPDWTKGNPYLDLLKQSVSHHGYEIAIRNYPSGSFPINRLINDEGPLRVLHLHWINDLISNIHWSNNSFKRYIKLLLLALDILTARARGVKVAWTIHNLVAHECPDEWTEIQARRVIALTCTHLFVHSLSALRLVEKVYQVKVQSKTSVVQQGNWDGCYSLPPRADQMLRRRYRIDPEDVVILFFGAIRPYKGVERLMSAFRSVAGERLRLLIAGNPATDHVARSLRDDAKNDPRIILALGYVPEDEVAAYFSVASVVALPFERILNSASAMLAFTMERALLVSGLTRVLDYVNDDNSLFFDSDDELRSRIAALDKGKLASMGRNGRLSVQAFTWASMGAQVADGYESERTKNIS